MKRLILSLFAVLSILATSTTFADDTGGQDAGGGNVFEAEFKTVGLLLYKQISGRRLTSEQLGFPLVKLEVALREVRPVGTDKSELELNGEDRHAINSRNQKLIVFSNTIWAILNNEQKQMLVLHEYLRFVDVDDSEYAYSIKIMGMLKNIAPTPNGNATVYELMAHPTRPGYLAIKGQPNFIVYIGWNYCGGIPCVEFAIRKPVTPRRRRHPDYKTITTFTKVFKTNAEASNFAAYAQIVETGVPVFVVVDRKGSFHYQ